MALPSAWGRFLAAIRAQESGGNYSEDTAGCLGAYCWNAQSNWDDDARAAGQTRYVGVNPSQVPSRVQDQVASHTLYAAYQGAGGGTRGFRAAAMVWNGGQPTSEPNPGLPSQSWAKHCGGGSSAAYACQVLTRMGLGGHYLAGSGSGSGGVVLTSAPATSDCAIGIPSQHVGLFFGHGPTVGGACLLSKSEVRALFAIGNIIVGAAAMALGIGFTLAFTRTGRQILTVASIVVPETRAAGVAGAAVSQPGERLTAAERRSANANRKKLAGKKATP